MKYFIFLDNRDFEQGSLEEHLTYLRNYDGTPDFWDSKDDLLEALQTAKDQIEYSTCRAVITDEDYKVIETYNPNHYFAIRKVAFNMAPETHTVKLEYYDEAGGFELRITKGENSRHGNLLIAGEGTKEITLLDIESYKNVYHGENESLDTYIQAVKDAIKEELY